MGTFEGAVLRGSCCCKKYGVKVKAWTICVNLPLTSLHPIIQIVPLVLNCSYKTYKFPNASVHYLFLHQTILLVKGSAGSQWVLVIKDNGIGYIF